MYIKYYEFFHNYINDNNLLNNNNVEYEKKLFDILNINDDYNLNLINLQTCIQKIMFL